ncbi:MAG: hypothetical protein HC765_07445 [Brachymonas sp.]|nr:hypothetical protein [Brachymonas sp.]
MRTADALTAYNTLDGARLDWILLTRYPNAEQADDELARTAPGTSEFVHRNQFAAWAEYMGQADA